MSTTSFVSRFNLAADNESLLETRLIGYGGTTADGNHVINYQEVDPATEEVVYEGSALYFRNNDLADIQVDDLGRITSDHSLNSKKEWIVKVGGSFDMSEVRRTKITKK